MTHTSTPLAPAADGLIVEYLDLEEVVLASDMASGPVSGAVPAAALTEAEHAS